MNNKYKPMMCPVCNEFFFSEMQEGDDYLEFYCSRCGWNYDLHQAENPDSSDGENEMSVNEYREWYQGKLKENPDYDYEEENAPDPIPHKCPVCGKYEFADEASFDICPYCGWEDDPVMEAEPDYTGGANYLCLNDFRKQYQRLLAENPKYRWDANIE